MSENLEPSLSTLVLSLASSATFSLGLAPDPNTQKTEKNLEMAAFNIDLLEMLRSKTKNNLTKEEQAFLDLVISDLQMKFVQVKGGPA